MNTMATTRGPVPSAWERCYKFHPDYLAVLTRVNAGERGSLVEFRFTASGKPVLVHIGERFRALIMPIRNV